MYSIKNTETCERMKLITKITTTLLTCFVAFNVSIFGMWVFYIVLFVDTTLPLEPQDTLASFYEQFYSFLFRLFI